MTVTTDTISRVGFIYGSLQPVTVWTDEDFGLIASLRGDKSAYFVTNRIFQNGNLHTDAGEISIAWWKEINDQHNADCKHTETHTETFDESESVYDYRTTCTICSHCKKLIDQHTEVFGYDEDYDDEETI